MAIVSISSRISRGYIGNTASAFAARRLGVDVWEVPTVVWPHHPGHGKPSGLIAAPDQMDAMLGAFERQDWMGQIDMVMTGYFRDAGQVEVAAGFIRRLRAARHQFQVLVDPVCGDARGTYVSAEVIDAIKTKLLPLADIATPNRFELNVLTEGEWNENVSLVHAARALDVETVAITSAFAETLGIANLLVEPRNATLHETLAFPDPPHGTGDLFAGVFATRMLKSSAREAHIHAGNTVYRVIEATAFSGQDELDLAHWNDLIEAPPHTGNIVHVRSTNA